MRKIVNFWKILFFDTLGVLFLIASLLTSWLPGPGGIPLLIIALSLFAVNHSWAKRYTTLLRQYADKLGDYIFLNNPWVQLAYDVVGAIMVLAGAALLWYRPNTILTGFGVSLSILGITLLLGNRGRWNHIKELVKRKH